MNTVHNKPLILVQLHIEAGTTFEYLHFNKGA